MYPKNLRALPFRELAALCFAEGDPDPAAAPADPAPEPVAEAPPEAEPAAEPLAEAPPAPEEPPKPKSPVAQLQGRVGHLTKQLHGKDARIAELEALIQGGVPEPVSEPGAYDEAEVERRATAKAQEIARAQTFNEKANAVYNAGKSEFPDFDEKVGLLRDLGVLGPQNVTVAEAAMATGEAHKVLHALGNDPEEAMRIASLPPIQMAAELTKMAQKLNAKPSPQVSTAPPPIKPLGGVAQTEPDVYNPDLYRGETVSDDYIALRAKSGAPWYSKYQRTN